MTRSDSEGRGINRTGKDKGINRAGEGVLRASYGCRSYKMDAASSFN